MKKSVLMVGFMLLLFGCATTPVSPDAAGVIVGVGKTTRNFP